MGIGWAELLERSAVFWSFEYAFALRALLACVFVGILGGVLGVFLVLQRLSLLGDTVGHATLPGLALGFWLAGGAHEVSLLMGALGSALLSAWVVGVLTGLPRTRPDAILGIVLAVFFGAGLVLLGAIQRGPTVSQAAIMTFLLGNAAAVTEAQLRVLVGCAGAALLAVWLGWRPLVQTTFDAVSAEAAGVRVRWVRLVMVVALASAIVVSVRVVGAVLVAAVLIIPASSALLWARRPVAAVVVAAVLGAVAGVLGAWVSFVLPGAATGPSMVLASALVFGAMLGVRGLAARIGFARRLAGGGHAGA